MLTDDLSQSSNPLDVDRRDILADVNVACRTTLDILNDLLCFDKMESGILVVHKHAVPVLSFITDCVGMFSAQAREGGVLISFTNGGGTYSSGSIKTILEDSDTVFMDRFKMDQVLRNLISNALKFTPRGGSVLVTARFEPECTSLNFCPGTADFSSSSQDKNCTARTVSVRTSFISGLMGMSGKGKASARVASGLESEDNSLMNVKGKLVIEVKDSGTGMLEEDFSRLFKEIVQFNPEVLQVRFIFYYRFLFDY